MSLEEQRENLAKIIEEAKKSNAEMKKKYEPIEITKGFWFKYQNRTFVFKGLKDNEPEFVEMIKLEEKPIFQEPEYLKNVLTILEKIDLDNMTLLEAVIMNILTGKTFVKNSWSEDAKSRLQSFIYDKKLITQDENKISTKSSSIRMDSSDRYSLYKGSFKSLIDSDNEKIKKLKDLEREILPFYSKIKEYEDLKRDLNL